MNTSQSMFWKQLSVTSRVKFLKVTVLITTCWQDEPLLKSTLSEATTNWQIHHSPRVFRSAFQLQLFPKLRFTTLGKIILNKLNIKVMEKNIKNRTLRHSWTNPQSSTCCGYLYLIENKPKTSQKKKISCSLSRNWRPSANSASRWINRTAHAPLKIHLKARWQSGFNRWRGERWVVPLTAAVGVCISWWRWTWRWCLWLGRCLASRQSWQPTGLVITGISCYRACRRWTDWMDD